MRWFVAGLAIVLSGPVMAGEYNGQTGMVPLASIRGSDACFLFNVVNAAGTFQFALDPSRPSSGLRIQLIIARSQANLPVTIVTSADYNPPLDPFLAGYSETIPCPVNYVNGQLISGEITNAAGVR